jgi:hypothetical protein
MLLGCCCRCRHRGGLLPAELSPLVDRGLRLVRVDFAPAHRQPSGLRVAAALALSVAGSLAVDALLVTLGEAVFPSTKGFGHFQFSDYAKLTVIGVVIAGLAWPVVTRISSAAVLLAGHRGHPGPVAAGSLHLVPG